MKKIIVLVISENGDVDVMDRNSVKLEKSILDDIFDTYKRLNITEKKKDIDKDYSEIFKYDYSKKSSLDVNSYANV